MKNKKLLAILIIQVFVLAGLLGYYFYPSQESDTKKENPLSSENTVVASDPVEDDVEVTLSDISKAMKGLLEIENYTVVYKSEYGCERVDTAIFDGEDVTLTTSDKECFGRGYDAKDTLSLEAVLPDIAKDPLNADLQVSSDPTRYKKLSTNSGELTLKPAYKDTLSNTPEVFLPSGILASHVLTREGNYDACFDESKEPLYEVCLTKKYYFDEDLRLVGYELIGVEGTPTWEFKDYDKAS